MVDINNNELIEDFESFLRIEKRYSDNTIYGYIKDLRMFLDDLSLDIEKISKSDIDNYILKNLHKFNEATLNRKLSSIRTFYKYLNNYKGYVNITDELESLKSRYKLPKFLTIDEVDSLLNIELKDKYSYRNKALLELMYSTGLRATETIRLDINSIDFVNRVTKVMGKGKKERIVPLSDISIKYLNIYINEYRNKFFNKRNKYDEALFLNNHGKRMTRNAINLLLKNIASSKNINKEITPHVLRHSFATHMLENGADIRSVQELLGHENVVTTEIYTHIANNYISKNYEEYFSRETKE